MQREKPPFLVERRGLRCEGLSLEEDTGVIPFLLLFVLSLDCREIIKNNNNISLYFEKIRMRDRTNRGDEEEMSEWDPSKLEE